MPRRVGWRPSPGGGAVAELPRPKGEPQRSRLRQPARHPGWLWWTRGSPPARPPHHPPPALRHLRPAVLRGDQDRPRAAPPDAAGLARRLRLAADHLPVRRLRRSELLVPDRAADPVHVRPRRLRRPGQEALLAAGADHLRRGGGPPPPGGGGGGGGRPPPATTPRPP